MLLVDACCAAPAMAYLTALTLRLVTTNRPVWLMASMCWTLALSRRLATALRELELGSSLLWFPELNNLVAMQSAASPVTQTNIS
jgi:hypothetical protein